MWFDFFCVLSLRLYPVRFHCIISFSYVSLIWKLKINMIFLKKYKKFLIDTGTRTNPLFFLSSVYHSIRGQIQVISLICLWLHTKTSGRRCNRGPVWYYFQTQDSEWPSLFLLIYDKQLQYNVSFLIKTGKYTSTS